MTVEVPLFNPSEPGFRDNPYDQYARLRRLDPVHRSALGFWVLTRYDDIHALLRDQRVGSGAAIPEDAREAMLRSHGVWEEWETSPARAKLQSLILFKDPPDHTRLRRLVSRAFTPRAVEGLRQHIERVTDQLVGSIQIGQTVDIIDVLAFQLPALVICEMLGVPPADRNLMRDWSAQSNPLLDPTASASDFISANEAATKQYDYLYELIEDRRSTPRADLLTVLVQAEADGDRLSMDELLATTSALFSAGHETTKNLIGNSILALLRCPDQLACVRADPGLLENAIEEFLRFDPPVQAVSRVIREPIDVEGGMLEAGDRVVAVLGAGNHDPLRYSCPDELDVRRADVQPLSFGGGVHFCLGAALARTEGHVALRALLGRFPRWELVDGSAVWRDSFLFRGLDELQVTFA